MVGGTCGVDVPCPSWRVRYRREAAEAVARLLTPLPPAGLLYAWLALSEDLLAGADADASAEEVRVSEALARSDRMTLWERQHLFYTLAPLISEVALGVAREATRRAREGEPI